MTREPDFVELNEELDRVLADPEVRQSVDTLRAEMDEADRLYTRGVDALRRAANSTHEQLAAEFGLTHPVVQPNARKDPLLATLNSKVRELGVQVELLVTLETGEKTRVDLSHFSDGDNPSSAA